MTDWTNEQIEKLVHDAMRRSVTDPEFRNLLLKEPRKALSKIDPRPLPDIFQPQFVNKGAKALTVELPEPINTAELSEAELELVAGGAGELPVDDGNNNTACCITIL